jgi:xylan 1,4-beta-xylosidase
MKSLLPALLFSLATTLPVSAQSPVAVAPSPPPANTTAPAAPAPTPAAPFPVAITVDAAQPVGPWKPIYRFFGADEPNYAYMKDGEKLIKELGELAPPDVYFRAHNLLTTGNGTAAFKWGSTNAYTEDAKGNPVYDWTIVDLIFDTYLKHGVRPYVEVGFTPEAMSIHPEPYQHHWDPTQSYSAIYTGWSYPPKDYAKWGELVYQWAKHCVDKYGAAEVNKWYWEIWNESNAGGNGRPAYWRSTPQDFMKLHDYAVAGILRALPTARVGGPDAAGNGGQWTRNFLEHCLTGTNYATGAKGTKIDFISFHAKGSPTFVNGHVRMGLSNQLRAMDGGFAIVASYPELKNTPIVIGESDPDGCAACEGPQLGYRNTALYPAYTAAGIAREFELADRHGVNLEGALTWAFEFEDQPFFAGQRTLATNGIDLPILNLFRMYKYMDGQRISTNSTAGLSLDAVMRSGVRGAPDVSALATFAPGKLCVMVWHYHDDDVPGPDANVTLNLTHLPAAAASAKLTQYCIDENHSNAFTVWKQLGSPVKPTPDQYATLEKAGHLGQVSAPALTVSGNQSTVRLSLPRQSISLLVLDWTVPKTP